MKDTDDDGGHAAADEGALQGRSSSHLDRPELSVRPPLRPVSMERSMSLDTMVKELPNTAYEPRDPVELIPNHLIADVVLLVGKKAAGKSQMVAHWAACITNGKEFVPGVTPLVKGHAVIFHGERSIESTLIPRLIAAGVLNYQKTVHLPRACTLEEAARILVDIIAKDPNVKIVFIDPLNHYLGGMSPSNAKARQLLKPFLDICERHGICVVLVHHFTKSGNKDLVDLIGGSGGWAQAAGSIWVVARIKDTAILQHLECNDLPTEGQCYEYAIEPVTLDPTVYPRRTKPTSRVVMLGRSPVDIQTALKLGKNVSGSCVPGAMLAIEQFLKPHGTVPSASVVKHLEELGISQATWKRARTRLHEEGRLLYVSDGRNTWWRWFEPGTTPAPGPSEHPASPAVPAPPESAASESQSEPPQQTAGPAHPEFCSTAMSTNSEGPSVCSETAKAGSPPEELVPGDREEWGDLNV
jgi:hypothetical protein